MSKTAVILGAGSDVGKALAKEYASHGYSIILAGRQVQDLEITAKDIEIRHGQPVKVMQFDALYYSSHQHFVEGITSTVDVVVCAFGYLGDEEKSRQNFEEASRIIATNYNGAVSILNVFASKMQAQGEGIIIGISSVAGDRGRQSNYHYGSAKAGFTAYLSGLRNFLYKRGVHVLTVKPGFMQTKMTDHLDLPPLLITQPGDAARIIYKAADKRINVVYVSPIWFFIMTIIKLIPEFIFKKMKL